MRLEHRVFVYAAALDVLPKSGRKRELVIQFIRSLSEIYFLNGDFEVVDPETSRTIQISIVSNFEVSWWIDGAVKEVKVIAIRKLAR